MKLKALQTVFALAAVGAAAHAQAACPTPDRLTGAALSAEDYYAAMAGPEISKGEFETTAEFQARLALVERPSGALVLIDTTPDDFKYEADSESFRFLIFNLQPSRSYSSAYTLKGSKPDFGDYNYGSPVDLKIKEVETDRSEYMATNAYGAQTAVTKIEKVEYVIFDNRGRKRMVMSDDLFSERKEFEMSKLSIPVPRVEAQAVKEGLSMVAYATGKQPWAIESMRGGKPTRDVPIDVNSTFRIAFADIECVGVRDGEGRLLAHWATR